MLPSGMTLPICEYNFPTLLTVFKRFFLRNYVVIFFIHMRHMHGTCWSSVMAKGYLIPVTSIVVLVMSIWTLLQPIFTVLYP